MALCTAAVAVGAWLMVTPFILKYRAELKLAEADALQSTVAQIQNLEQIKGQISDATGTWLNIQGECARTVATAKEVADGMAAEAKNFMEFMQRANDSEKATLRLEVDKMKRMEGEWLQVEVRTLDHVYALHRAGQQSGQPSLAQQLAQFQHACRDAARRVGLAPYEPEPGEPFDPQKHQAADPNVQPGPESRIAQTVATGYTFQGQLLRPALVLLAAAESTPVAQVQEAIAAAPEEQMTAPVEAPSAPTTPPPEVTASDAKPARADIDLQPDLGI